MLECHLSPHAVTADSGERQRARHAHCLGFSGIADPLEADGDDACGNQAVGDEVGGAQEGGGIGPPGIRPAKKGG